MKKVKLTALSVLLVGFSLLTACSKEDKINKNLWKNGGEWDIETFISKQTSSNEVYNFNETYPNAGSFKFDKNGSGSVSLAIGGESQSESFTYTNTEDQLTLIIDNEARIFDLEWEKNDLQLTITENFESNGDSHVYTEIFVLKKK